MVKRTQIFHTTIWAALSEADKLQLTIEIAIDMRIADQFVQLKAHFTFHALRL